MLERLVLVAVVAACAGCRLAHPACEAMPKIVVRPGLAGRLALMDQYRYDDEIRRRMMARPQVWVEEVTEDELPAAAPADVATGDGAGAEEPSER